jgi:RNA polymerase sigma-70 factor (ECF subfamily)
MNGVLTATEPTSEVDLSEILGQIARRNQEAMADLYDRTSALIYGLALRMLGEKCAAEEITQDVYMQVWRKAETFDPARGSVLSWMVTIARSRALDKLRASKARLSREDDSESVDFFRDPSPDPEHASSESERVRFVRQLLSDLPTNQRNMIELAFFSGLTHSEIATRTGLPLGTIKARIRTGMIQLREQLSFLHGANEASASARQSY